MASDVKMVPIPRRGVDYRNKIVLAPMVRTGELPLRLTALKYGADLVWGPETVDRSMLGTTRRVNPETNAIEWTRIASYGHKQPPPDAKESVIYRLHPEREGGKLIFQIGTADPERAVAAARLVAADVVGIDVNAGCPKPFSTSGGMGAALLRTPDKLCAILRALVEHIMPEFEIGISVKIRLLETAEETEKLVRQLCATGITALTVHCRTTPMRPREPAIRGQLRMVANLCREAGVACLMNGDVKNRDQALKLVEEFGVDGAMIATTAETNPSCFRSQADGGLVPWRRVAEDYIQAAMDVHNRYANTKYVLCCIIPGKDQVFQSLQRSRSYTEVCRALGYDNLLETAEDVDIKLGITPKAANPTRRENAQHKTANKTALAASGQMLKARQSGHERRKSLSERGALQPSEGAGNVALSI